MNMQMTLRISTNGKACIVFADIMEEIKNLNFHIKDLAQISGDSGFLNFTDFYG